MSGVHTWREGHAAFSGASEPRWLQERRAAGLARHEVVGFPTGKTEAWKYTQVKRWTSLPLAHRGSPGEVDVESVRIPAAAAEIVVVDGHVVWELSRVAGLEWITVVPISVALAGGGSDQDRVLAERYVGRCDADADGFEALSAAFVQDGVIVRVEDKVDLAGVLHVIVAATGGPVVSHALHVLSVGARAKVRWLETYVGAAEGLVDSTTRMEVGEGAEVSWHAIGVGGTTGARIVRTSVQVARDGRWSGHATWIDGGLTRSEIRVRLTGPGASCALDGLYVLDGDAHVDNHTVIDHAAPHCTTRESYRGVLGGASRGVFDGTVIVREGADGTDAVQSCKNLLVSDEAEASAKPRLEIYADDVKCAHGTTVGTLNAAELAYLRMRGIPLVEARRMLTEAFVGDAVRQIGHEDVSEVVGERVWARLGALFGAAT